MDEDVVEVNRSLRLPVAEFTWRFTASGGPGGQHANTSNTRVELVFDVAGSPTLSPSQRERLVAAVGPEVRVVSSRFRSQTRNRADAIDRLAAMLADALTVRAQRRPTRPTRGSQTRRVDAKKQRSSVKKDRRRPSHDD
jgi:ribosome-associated protein